MSSIPDESAMYRALLRRDAAYDGVFIVAVKTTGIFCRPVCTARKPRRKNVEFFATTRDALCAGYRPCKRCRPMDVHRKPPAWVRRLMDAVDQAPSGRFTDADLRALSIEPARARRYFKEHYGMTFHAYHRARRMGLALAAVREGQDLNAVGLQHGFGSASGFRDAFARIFGRPPGRGKDVRCLLAGWLDTPLGAMLAVAGDDGLHMLEFVDRRAIERQIETLRKRLRAVIVPGTNEHLERIGDELARYFAGRLTEFTVPTILTGSPFQVQVWNRLAQIPYGQTLSYSQMAADIGRAGTQRAVGRANGDNRIGIVLPCHRVVRSDGTLCGYGGGVWRKKWLLDHERCSAADEQPQPCVAIRPA